jgi:hypothetical protein
MPAAEQQRQLAPRPATSSATAADPVDPSRRRRVGPVEPAPPPPPAPAAPAQPAPPRGRVPALCEPPPRCPAPTSTPPPARHKHHKPQQNRTQPSHPVHTLPACPSRHQAVSAASTLPSAAWTPLLPRPARPGRPSRPRPPASALLLPPARLIRWPVGRCRRRPVRTAPPAPKPTRPSVSVRVLAVEPLGPPASRQELISAAGRRVRRLAGLPPDADPAAQTNCTANTQSRTQRQPGCGPPASMVQADHRRPVGPAPAAKPPPPPPPPSVGRRTPLPTTTNPVPAVLVPAAADHGRPAGRHAHQTTPQYLIAGPGASFAACRPWDSNPELGLLSRSSSLRQQLQRRIQTPSGGCQCARTRFEKCTTRVGRLTWTHKEASGTADRRGSALCASQQASPTILASSVSRC